MGAKKGLFLMAIGALIDLIGMAKPWGLAPYWFQLLGLIFIAWGAIQYGRSRKPPKP